MIAYKTFSGHKGMTARGMREVQDDARAQAKEFIAAELNDGDVISITESALPSTWSRCLVSVTVWYKKN